MRSMISLLGAYNNLDESPEFLNIDRNILGVVISSMIVTWICALLRLYVRLLVSKAPGWDDVFVTLSLLSTTAGTISICVAVTEAGMGEHFLLIGAVKQLRYLKVFYVANATYPFSAGWVKLALLFQYLRAYDRKSRVRKLIIAVILVTAAWCIAFGFLALFPCIPVNAYWDLSVPATRYAFGSLYVEPFVAIYTSLTSTNMVLDLIVMGIAAPLLLYGEKKGETKRWALVSLFCLGSIASVIAIARLAFIIRNQATTYPTFDPTWYAPTPTTLAALEVDFAVISAALPVFCPVLRNMTSLNILVTREVKVTMESRRLSKTLPRSTSSGSTDPDDDAIELHRSESGLQQGSDKTYYDNTFVQQQVDPLSKAEYGTVSEVIPFETKSSSMNSSGNSNSNSNHKGNRKPSLSRL